MSVAGSLWRVIAALSPRRLHGRLQQRSLGNKSTSLLVLGVESSCDDTGAAVVRGDGKILGQALHTQLAVHKKTGGIVPLVAGELHKENLQRIVQLSLERSRCNIREVSAIAVTTGPGLAPCLKAGLTYAKQLAREVNKPLLSVHHMEAHALTVRMEANILFPYLVLLISGGHCILAVAMGVGQFYRLGQTGDDSPGEALDKVARWLRLETHPEVAHLAGGAAVEKLAERGDPDRFKLPQVMTASRCCNFSFAGLKTAARVHIARVASDTAWTGESPLPHCEDLCASFQHALARHLLTRTHRALLYCKRMEPAVLNLVVSGGVASNNYLRLKFQMLAAAEGFGVHFPSPYLCTDNGAMIAWAGIEYLNSCCGDNTNGEWAGQGGGDRLYHIDRLPMLDFQARWDLGEDHTHLLKRLDISTKRLSRIM